ncbi:MAG: hypothetical protein GY866_12045 [Proteobacteria bacterium]|nr:hypothetical protein [Pseudomonadota bacterium]
MKEEVNPGHQMQRQCHTLFAPETGSLHIRHRLRIPEKFFDCPAAAVARNDFSRFPIEFVGERIFDGFPDWIAALDKTVLAGESVRNDRRDFEMIENFAFFPVSMS